MATDPRHDELERALRDLLSLLALPALWSGREPAAVLRLLFEALEGLLPIELAYASTAWLSGQPPLEVCRVGGVPAGDDVDWLRAAIRARVDAGGGEVDLDDTPLGGLHAYVSPLGFYGIRGVVLVASRREGFPTAMEATFIRTAVSLAATGLETARALHEREAANRAKDEFLAMLGHELRNPLAPIHTALHLIKLKGAAQSERELEIIGRQVAHLSGLVDDLLDISRVTRGVVELNRQTVPLVQVVTRAVETASPLLERHRHHLSLAVPTDLHVQADPARLAQVLSNLLTNAAKYTPPGGQIEVLARREGAGLAVTVRDDGAGIPPTLQPHIFDLFVQGHTTVHRAEGGLGIGLALVKNLVALHGGSVSVYSQGEGHGSEFTVRLPAVPGVAPPAEPALPLATATGRRRVLVVDDNADAVEVLGDLLRRAGHEVVVATESLAALTLASSFRPDVMVLDIGMPVMDGYQLAAAVRDALGDAAPRMVALTGYGQEQDRAKSRAAGFAGHLTKPVDVQRLLAALTDQPASR